MSTRRPYVNLPVSNVSVVLFPNDETLAYQLQAGPGVTIAQVGTGIVAIGTASEIALTQSSWFVDPTNGSDSASGNSPETAVRTFGEIAKRWGSGTTLQPSGGVVTVTLLGDLPASDAISLRGFSLGSNVFLVITGSITTVRNGIFSGVTAINPAANIPQQATTPASMWTPGERVIVTAGSAVGSSAWVAVDLGEGAARFSNPAINPAATDATNNPSAGSFATSDHYDVQSLSSAYIDDVSLGGDFANQTSYSLPRVTFENLNILGRSTLLNTRVGCNFIGCKLDAYVDVQASNDVYGDVFANCCATNQINVSNAIAALSSGLVLGDLSANVGSAMILDDQIMVQGGTLFTAYSGFISIHTGACVFDGGGVLAGGGSIVYVNFNATLWGTDNDYGVTLNAGGKMIYVSGTSPSVLKITGSSGDFMLGKRATARAWDEAGGVYTATIDSTWANLATAISSAGLGGNAHDLTTDTHIVPLVNS